MAPFSAAGGGKGGFKWEFKTVRVLSGLTEPKLIIISDPPTTSLTLHFFISTSSFFLSSLRPERPLVVEPHYGAEKCHSETRDHAGFAARPLYLVFFYIYGE